MPPFIAAAARRWIGRQASGGARGSGDRADGGDASVARGRPRAPARRMIGKASDSGSAAGRGGPPRRSRSGRGEAGRTEAARQADAPDAFSLREPGARTGTAAPTSAARSSASRRRGRDQRCETLTARNLMRPARRGPAPPPPVRNPPQARTLQHTRAQRPHARWSGGVGRALPRPSVGASRARSFGPARRCAGRRAGGAGPQEDSGAGLSA